jgi:hypothetical protein
MLGKRIEDRKRMHQVAVIEAASQYDDFEGYKDEVA